MHTFFLQLDHVALRLSSSNSLLLDSFLLQVERSILTVVSTRYDSLAKSQLNLTKWRCEHRVHRHASIRQPQIYMEHRFLLESAKHLSPHVSQYTLVLSYDDPRQSKQRLRFQQHVFHVRPHNEKEFQKQKAWCFFLEKKVPDDDACARARNELLQKVP